MFFSSAFPTTIILAPEQVACLALFIESIPPPTKIGSDVFSFICFTNALEIGFFEPLPASK